MVVVDKAKPRAGRSSLQEIAQQGVAVLETQTMQQNTTALAMYTRLGFHEVDRGTVFRKQDDPSAIPATLPEQQIPLGTIRPTLE